MPVEIEIDGVATANIKNYSVQEDATPIEPSSSFGGVGTISFGINETPDTVTLLGTPVLVTSDRGKVGGYIRSLNSTDGNASVTADSVLSLFNTERTVVPYVGTLGGAVQAYCDLVGITNDVYVDPSIASRAVTYPGWKGNVWVNVKQMLVKEQVEMAVVFDRVVVRPLRQLIATLDRTTTQGWSIDNTNAARAIEINYYNHVYGTQQEVFPLTTEEPTIYSVDAGETQVVQIPLNASMLTVNQPVAQDWVDDTTYSGTNGVYAVNGNDNLPITAAQWTAQGGSVTVAITDDPSVLELTIVGASMTDYAPYRLAMSSGAGNDYNALHITGTGVVWDKQTVTLLTGATGVVTSEEVGVTIDSPFISTREDAFSLGLKAAQAYAGLTYTITGNALDVNRPGAGDDLVYATVEDFNTLVTPGTTVASFNATWAGETVADFNEYWQATVDGLFGNQLFGNAIGARVLMPDACFRISTATTTEGSVSYSATLDTLVSDFNTAWAGETVADFNARMAGKTFQQFAAIPLRSN